MSSVHCSAIQSSLIICLATYHSPIVFNYSSNYLFSSLSLIYLISCPPFTLSK